MALTLLSLFNLYRYTPGRRAWMLRRISQSATELGLGELAAAATALVEPEKTLAAGFRTWTTVRAGTESSEVSQKLVASDQQRDATLGAFDAFLAALAGRTARASGQAAVSVCIRAGSVAASLYAGTMTESVGIRRARRGG